MNGLTLEKLRDEVAGMMGRVCLVHDHDVIRLDGVAEDDCDIYYVGVSGHGRVTWYSAVGDCFCIEAAMTPEQVRRILDCIALNEARVAEEGA